MDWGFENLVREAQRSHPGPEGGPANRLFVPYPVRSRLLELVHSSRLTCHPGSCHTLAFLRQWFLKSLPSAPHAQCVLRTRLHGKLLLASFSHYWSLIVPGLIYPSILSLGFPRLMATCHSDSGGSIHKGRPFYPSPQTTFCQVDGPAYGAAWLSDTWTPGRHGLRSGFLSQFWKAFCTLIGSSASLSSGFHPQTNGQS